MTKLPIALDHSIMNSGKNLLLFFLIYMSMTACVITNDPRTTQIEIMKPGIFNIPENTKTIALINSISSSQDDKPFKYLTHSIFRTDSFDYHETKMSEFDSTIKYMALSNTCLDALAWALKKDGYFNKVINYHDSLTIFNPSNKDLFDPEKLFQETNSDLCIFLDHFSFDIEKFLHYNPLTNKASLSWTIVYKKDTLSYSYKQIDTLTFTTADFPPELTDNMKMKMVVNNSATFFGQAFCSKIIPTWIPVDRTYYTSNNQNMLKAEKFALTNDWLKAAEIWNEQTKSKNSLIAAKATYNMALACEMVGKPDTAIDWLLRSYSILKKNNKEHKANCMFYINILTVRKKEIEKLNKQVRN